MLATMTKLKATSISLGQEDRETINLIRKRYHLNSDAAAIRFALMVLGRAVRQERGGREEDTTDGEGTSTE